MSIITFYIENGHGLLLKTQNVSVESDLTEISFRDDSNVFHTLNLEFKFKDDNKEALNIETIRISKFVKISSENSNMKERFHTLENEIRHRNQEISKLMTERQNLLKSIDDSLEDNIKETIEEVEFKSIQIALHKRKIQEIQDSNIEIKYDIKTEHYFIDLYPGVKEFFSHDTFLIKILYAIDCEGESQNTSHEILDSQTITESIPYSSLNMKVKNISYNSISMGSHSINMGSHPLIMNLQSFNMNF